MAILLLRALSTYNKKHIRIHYYFDFFALAFNIIGFLIYLGILFRTKSQSSKAINFFLFIIFATQIPFQIWAITVVKTCYEFFILIHVLIEIAK